jgi:hypothetical protein
VLAVAKDGLIDASTLADQFWFNGSFCFHIIRPHDSPDERFELNEIPVDVLSKLPDNGIGRLPE